MRTLLVFAMLLTAGGAIAQHNHWPAAPSPSTAGYEAAMMTMHRDMAIPYSGDADQDFLAGMIPHHEAAVAMAQVLLAHGHDAETRRLAETIIADQTREIAQMPAALERLRRPG